MDAPPEERAGDSHPDEPEVEFYATWLLLPLIVGIAALAAGLVLLSAGPDRSSALVALLDTGVALIAVAIVLYFVIGFWLIPGSLALAGVAFLAAFEVESRLRGGATIGGGVLVALGLLGLAQALRRTLRWMRSRKR